MESTFYLSSGITLRCLTLDVRRTQNNANCPYYTSHSLHAPPLPRVSTPTLDVDLEYFAPYDCYHIVDSIKQSYRIYLLVVVPAFQPISACRVQHYLSPRMVLLDLAWIVPSPGSSRSRDQSCGITLSRDSPCLLDDAHYCIAHHLGTNEYRLTSG